MRRGLGRFAALCGILLTCLLHRPTFAATDSSLKPGPNVNMVSGTGWPGGDPFLQRQNEPSIAASSRNPLHLLAAANDYRSVDIPGILGEEENGDAWIGLFTSLNGGLSWKSTLMPGCPYNIPECDGAPAIKGLQAAADPLVRAGTNGLFYVSGIAFNRGTNAAGMVFVGTYIDNNNKENGNPIKLVRLNVIDTGTSGQFLDKPWLAVDVPRSGANTITIPQDAGGGSFPVGNIYFVYSRFVGSDINNPHSQVMFTRSTDGGQTWSTATKLSESYSVNQGTTMAINPANGEIYVAWRDIQNASANEPNAIVFCKSSNFGQTFSKASIVSTINPFDQGTSALGFRTTAFPTMAVDGNGVIYLAWSQRGLGPNGEAKIVVTTSTDGKKWSPYAAIDGAALPGHQFMPAAAYAGGKIMVTWYDSREDHTVGVFTPVAPTNPPTNGGQFTETRQPAPCTTCDSPSQVFGSSLSDAGLHRRHTIDLRVTQASPGASPVFETSTRVSQYKIGTRKNDTGSVKQITQLQFNAPNLPMFSKGTVPFMGDYNDLAPAVQFVKDSSGNWQFNTGPSSTPVFHVVWTDNRDVRQPGDGDWTNYKVPVSAFTQGTGTTSLFDPTQTRQLCSVAADSGQTGIRNQNIYTATIAQGLVVGTLGNTKPLLTPTGSKIQRSFVVFVQNKSDDARNYTINILPPATAQASFLPDQSVLSAGISIPARSTVYRTVWVTYPATTVTASKYDSVTVTFNDPSGALLTFITLNPDSTNPDITNPDGLSTANVQTQEVFSADISQADIVNRPLVNADIVNADIVNADIVNADIVNADIVNADIVNADIVNADIVNADIVNADIVNADIVNADIVNADIVNADIVNADIVNSSITDATWTVKNVGDTATSYGVKLLSGKPLPSGAKLQLIISKLTTTPVSLLSTCSVKSQAQNLLVASIPEPTLFDSSTDLQVKSTDVTSADAKNATLALAPGEIGKVTLRIVYPPRQDPREFIRTLKVGVGAQASPLALIITSLSLTDAVFGTAYQTPLTASGGTGSRTWEIIPDSTLTGLPPGLQLNTDGSFAGAPASVGTYRFKVKVTDTGNTALSIPSEKDIQVLTLNVVKAPATLSFDLASLTVTYSGSAQPVTVTTMPVGLAGVSILYNGSPTVPTGAGNYDVTASLSNSGYVAASISGTYAINPAPVSLTLGNLSQTYDGTAKTVSVTPVLGGTTVTYNGSTTPPVNVGNYSVVASLLNSNYLTTSTSGTMVISPAPATITLGSLDQTYDGTAKPVTVSTSPANLAVTVTYNGSNTVPVGAGSYNVVAALNDANYSATNATGVLTISKAGAAFVSTSLNLTATYDGQPKSVSVTTTPAGLFTVTVTYAGSATPPSAAGSYAVVAHLENANYSAPDAAGTLTINKATATLALSGLTATYDGSPKTVSVTTTPATLQGVTVTYAGLTTAPSAAGSYAVVARLDNANYSASDATGTLVISKANATVALGNLSQTYDGAGKAASVTTIPALLTTAVTYNLSTVLPVNAGSYSVGATVNDANYQGSANGTLVIAPAGQTITFNALPNTTWGSAPFGLTATASSGLSVSYAAAGNCTVLGSTVTLTGAGSCTITASQTGNTNYAAATSVSRSFTIAKASTATTITSDLPDPSTPGQAVTVIWSIAVSPSTAGTPSGIVTVTDGAVSCSAAVTAGGCSLALTVVGARTLTATYGGDSNFLGSSGTAPHTVQPLYTFIGFLTPLTTAGTEAAPSTSGTFNLGKAIPIKWQLKNASGAYVTDQSPTTTLQAVPNSACSGRGNGTPIPLSPSATGSTVLRYDATTNQYVFNWDTTYQAAGCYNLVVRLSDGTTKSTIVQLK